MIVRIMEEGQFQVSSSLLDELNVIDNRIVDYVAKENESDFKKELGKLIAMIKENGKWRTTNFNEGDNIIPDYNKQGYYEFTGNNNYSAMSVCAGITLQPTWNFFIYAGVGYAKEEYLMEIDEFSYEENNSTGKALVKNKDYSYTGFEMDAGLIYRLGKFIISGGATTINFQTFNWTAGVGVCF